MADNKSTKRTQLDKDKTKIFIILSIAAVVTIGSLVIAKGFFSQGGYIKKVTSQKEQAVKQLKDNQQAVQTLTEAYETFSSQSPNLLGGMPSSTDQRGGSNADLVLDALPNRYDFPALASSIERLLSGYDIRGISGVDDSLTQQAMSASGPVEIPFSVDVRANYDGLKQLISSFDRSIRPFHISRLELSGNNDSLNISIQAKSFYQPEMGLKITESQVQ